MRLAELCALYLLAGLISAFVVARQSQDVGRRRWLELSLSLLLWPLWLPVVLSRSDEKTSETAPSTTLSEQALYQGYEAVKGTPLEKLLPRESVERIAEELRRVVARDRELEQLLAQPSFQLEAALARVRELEPGAASPRALAIAQRHLENVERLAALHQRDRQLLAEIEDWLTTLRAQLVLARYQASSADGVGDIFAEICARVEVLGSTLIEPPLTMPEPPLLAWPNTFS